MSVERAGEISHMAREAAEAPEAVARFLERNEAALGELAHRLERRPPPVILTCARGSSDHAAGYLAYLAEILFGIPCCSIGASVVSVYGAELQVRGALCITVSQSGQSPDIVALQQAARDAGALTVALVNVEDSPVARSADICMALSAGPERSVAATKSCITALAAAAALLARWRGDRELSRAVADLPTTLAHAAKLDWPDAVKMAAEAGSLYVLGRGPALPIAAETALKLKETCAIHAEAYSLAEVMHGPLELLGEGFPVLVYCPVDRALVSSRQAIATLERTGARVLVVGPGELAHASTGHGLLDPIAMLQTAYRWIEATARTRGRDPDQPRHLQKVTETM